MGYVTNEDVERRLGSAAYVQLTDDEGSGSANEEIVDEARLVAEGEVDSYLARRFAVPVDVSDCDELRALLAGVTLDVVAYRLHSRRGSMPEEVENRYRSALDWLAGVGAGEIELPAAGVVASNPNRGVRAKVVGGDLLLSHDEMDGI